MVTELAMTPAAASGHQSLHFAVQVVRGRWFSLFASFLIMAGAGATYLFGVYSKEIKSSLGYDQTTLNLLGFFKDLGANVGVLSGLIAEGNHAGPVKGFHGIKGAIMTQVYLAIYGNDSKSLILLIGWLPAAISVVFVYTIRPMKVVRQPNELRIFYQFLYVSIVLALFLMVMTICQKLVTFPQAGYALSVTVVCALLFVPLFIAIREELVLWNQYPKGAKPISPSSHILEPTPKPKPLLEGKPKTTCFQDIFINKPERGEDYTILQALLSTDMLILLFATSVGLARA
ncbi:hypothetical protein C3L33_06816, partial [Rhododendron williamsianum]